jgi:hypothetical protein
MAAQPAPLESQRSHWYASVKRFPLHVPVEAARVLPVTAAPLIVGGDTFAGGCWPGADALPVAALVKRIVVTSAAVRAVATWRLIALLASGCMNPLVTLGWGKSRVCFTYLMKLGGFVTKIAFALAMRPRLRGSFLVAVQNSFTAES